MALQSYLLPVLASVLASLLVVQALPSIDRSSSGLRGMDYNMAYGSLCRAMCSGRSMDCPPECAFSRVIDWGKRSGSQRSRRFEDFSFDDILFMKLLGRNIGDRN